MLVVVTPSTYALIDCWLAIPVAELLAKLSSSRNALPSRMFNSVALASTAANLVKSACTKPETPSSRFNSAAVDVTAVPAIERTSTSAVPSINKLRHCWLAEPRSYVSSVLGIMLEFTSAPNTTLSAAESPSVRVPPLKVVVPVTVRLPPTSKLPSMSALPEMSKVAASSSPLRVILVAPVIAPLSATAPLISIVVAAICISVSATMSSCPSALELI